MIFLDTHVLVWLYAGDPELFSERAKQELRTQDLVVSPIVLLELQYLHEAKKITKHADVIFSALQKNAGVRMIGSGWEDTMRTALTLEWTRDPFDRIIVAQAAHRKVKLLTKDRHILRHYARAVW